LVIDRDSFEKLTFNNTQESKWKQQGNNDRGKEKEKLKCMYSLLTNGYLLMAIVLS